MKDKYLESLWLCLDDEWREYIAELSERIEMLEGFAWSILSGWPECDGEMMDGFDIQERGEKYGLLIPTEVTEPCGENCNCVEYGDFPMTCYRVDPRIIPHEDES